MPRHPNGSYTTWFGVIYGHEMHGDTGIGTSKLPKVTPEIALWGWAEVMRDGKTIAKMAAAHVMVMTKPPHVGVMLEVDTEEKGLLAVPDGYLSVMWPQVRTLALPTSDTRLRQVLGWIGMIAFVAGFSWLAWRERGAVSTR
jgi:hypothetical protein